MDRESVDQSNCLEEWAGQLGELCMTQNGAVLAIERVAELSRCSQRREILRGQLLEAMVMWFAALDWFPERIHHSH